MVRQVKGYKPKYNLKDIISFKLSASHDAPKGTVFDLNHDDDTYTANPHDKPRDKRPARWVDSAFKQKKVGAVRVYAQT